MPKNSIHCAISCKRTGKTYKELHKWLDEDKADLGVSHRSKKHFYTQKLRDEVFEKFGGSEAVSEWLFHIAIDNLDTYFTNEWVFNNNKFNFLKFGFHRNSYICCEESKFTFEELDKEFGEKETSRISH